MKKVLFSLILTALTVVGYSQVDTGYIVPNDIHYVYPTVNRVMDIIDGIDLHKKVEVDTRTDIRGGIFTVHDTSEHFVVDSGTVIGRGGRRVLVRQNFRTPEVRFWGIKGNDTTVDNSAKFSYIMSPAVSYTEFYMPDGTYENKHSVSLTKGVKFVGVDGYEMVGNGRSILHFPKGVTGVICNDANSAGSLLLGVTIASDRPLGGRALEYNPDNHTLLYLSPITGVTAGLTYEFYDVYSPDKVRGTATITNAGTANLVFSITYTQPAGTYVIGDTIVGSFSGARAPVRFVSKQFNALVLGTATGTFVRGETLTGSASHATSRYYSMPLPQRFVYARVATIGTTTGGLDNSQGTVLIDTTVNTDSVALGTTGTLDSLGATGKRQNVFREAGTYSVGILANRRISAEDITVFGFGGDGILITNIATPITNANLVRLNRVRINSNDGNGVRAIGGDANHISITNSTFVGNHGVGIVDVTFLGITEIANHASTNLVGGYTSASYINRRSTIINPYTEGGYVLPPWQQAEDLWGGGSTVMGGTHGMPNAAQATRTDGYSGAIYDIDNFQNNFFYIDKSIPKDPTVVIKTSGGTTHAFRLENRGNGSLGRGAFLDWGIPYGIGKQGINPNNVTLDIGGIIGTSVTGSKYALQICLRRSQPQQLTVTDGASIGSGAIAYPEVKGGKVQKIVVLAGGKGYSLNNTSAIFPNGTFNGSLNVIVADSIITDIELVSSDSTTTVPDNDIYPIYEFGGDGAFKTLATTPTSVPTYLTAVDVGGTTEHEMMSLKTTGNSGVGRGTTLGLYAPWVGTDPNNNTHLVAKIGGFWSNYNGHGSMAFSTGDSLQDMSYKMWINGKGTVSIGNEILPTNSTQLFVDAPFGDKGSMPFPKLTSAQINSLSSPVGGLFAYNSDRQSLWFRDDNTSKWSILLKTDTATITNGMLPVGNASTGTFNRVQLTAGSGITITNGAGSISIASTASSLSGTGYVKMSGSTPSYISSIPNADLTNSTISGVSLGGTLANLTATDATLTFSGTYSGGTARTIGLNLANNNVWTGDKTTFNSVSTSTANYGVLNVGSGPFDGSTTGFFVGSGSGTQLAINAGSGFGGRLIDAELTGTDKFNVDVNGNTFMAGKLGIGTSSPTSLLQISGGITSSSNFGSTGLGFSVANATYTSTTSSGTISSAGISSFGSVTYAASNATTITNAASVYIASAPSAGTNVTITNPYALYIPFGNVFVGNTAKISQLSVGQGNITASAITGISGVFYNGGGVWTITDPSTATSGTVANSAVNAVAVTSIAATNTGITYTNAYNWYIAGAPTAGTNVTISRAIALGVASGETSVQSLSKAYRASATSTTLTSADNLLELTATGQTATLPDATNCTGREYTIVLTASGTGTVGTTSSQNIIGASTATTYSLASIGKEVTVRSKGTGWLIISNN